MQITKTISSNDIKKTFDLTDKIAFTFLYPPQYVEFTTFGIICMGKLSSAYLTENCHPRRERSALLRMLCFL